MTSTLHTGVPGLDVVLGGGLQAGSITVIGGAPGTGKTTLAHQICFANATSERRAVYYTTLSEPHSKLARNLQAMTFFDAEALDTRIEHLHLGDLLRQQPGQMDRLVDEIVGRAMRDEPSVIVVDSAKALRDFAGDSQLRIALYDLFSRIAHTDVPLLLIGEYSPQEMASGVEFSLADGIVQLAYEPREPVDRRWLRVVKMRGCDHLVGKHTFRIGSDGFSVYPRIETRDSLDSPPLTGRLPSGVPGLDPLIAGGIPAGDATVVVGPSGAGKTVFGLQFATEGLGRGERCLYITLQATGYQLGAMAASVGRDIAHWRRTGQLVVHPVPLNELDLDILIAEIRRELTSRPITRVVLDSLTEMVLAARESERFPAYVRSLTSLVRAAGASLLISSESTALGPGPEPLGGITFLFDNVILLRYIELNSGTGRVMSILKMRNSAHDKHVHLFEIGRDGFTVRRRLDGVTGVLGWSALRAADAPTFDKAAP